MAQAAGRGTNACPAPRPPQSLTLIESSHLVRAARSRGYGEDVAHLAGRFDVCHKGRMRTAPLHTTVGDLWRLQEEKQR